MGINREQFNAVLMIEILLTSLMVGIAYIFWNSICAGNLKTCVGNDNAATLEFFFLSLLRPFFFTPIMITAMIAGDTFGSLLGTILNAVGASCSALLLYYPGYLFGQKIVHPWLSANLPSTWKLLKSQDYKIIFFLRWIPLFPFDLFSFLFGIFSLPPTRVFLYTFIGILPESYMFSRLGEPDVSLNETVIHLLGFAALTSLPLMTYEFFVRRNGSNIWTQLKRAYLEAIYEAQINNDISKKRSYDSNMTPVILIHGFGSSRRVLTIMERLLNNRGYQVMSFNLGGSLGVFFTRGIKDTAHFIDEKIRRQFSRHQFEKISIVAHSKGGLVAMWWLLKLGGSQYCNKLITLGTPFKGSRLTYLALVTPLGFFWKDVWQMRPGSQFLKDLHQTTIPENLKIYCCYSIRDRVAKGKSGLFEPMDPTSQSTIIPVPMHHITHTEFLYRRDVGDSLVRMLNG